jgi:hypothetical protein
VLFARWNWSAFRAEAEGMFDRFSIPQLVSNPNRAAGQGEAESLAVLDALAAEPVPDDPQTRYVLSADARLRLPGGRYRVVGTAADGLRVAIDDRRVMNVWPGRQAVRQDVADVELSGAGSATVRVEHYRTGGDDKLMVRLEPLDPAAAAWAASLGRRPRATAAVAAALDEAVREDAYHGWAFGVRGALHARAGRTGQAAADLAVATANDAAEPLWWQHRAAVAALTDGPAGHARAVGGWPAAAYPAKDRAAAARAAVAVLLRPGRPPAAGADRDRLDELLGTATTPSPLGGNPPQAVFARALMEYRLGQLAAAEALAADARALPAPAGHAVMCDLLLALARRDLGRAADARAASDAAAAGAEAWERVPEPHDPFDAFDWVACQVLRREAQQLH